MLLDGHHKAAACAAEGVPVPTLVIFPLMPEPALKAACDEKQRLYLHKPDRGFSVVVRYDFVICACLFFTIEWGC